MVSAILSRVVILVFGTLYPAYASYKAVKTKNVKEYVKWMMYWIVFALFCAAETFADVFLSWIPFYYEIKIIFVFWLLSPVTRGSSFIYRKFVHPQLAKREKYILNQQKEIIVTSLITWKQRAEHRFQLPRIKVKEIDEAIAQARTKGYSTLMTLGHRGLTYATNVVVNTAIKGQSTLVEQIKKSYSTNDLRVRDSRVRKVQDDIDGVPYIDDSDEEFGLTMRDSSTEIQTSGSVTQAESSKAETENQCVSTVTVTESSKAQTENQCVSSVTVTESSKSQTGTSGSKQHTASTKQHTGSILNKAQSKVKHTKSSDKTNLNTKKGTENRLRADNRELESREKHDHEKQRRHLSRSKSDTSERRPKRARPHSGLSRVEEVEHENSMAMMEKDRAGDANEGEEITETYTEEIIYYSPRKSGHYTHKEVKADPYATLPRTRSRQRPRLNQH